VTVADPGVLHDLARSWHDPPLLIRRLARAVRPRPCGGDCPRQTCRPVPGDPQWCGSVGARRVHGSGG
jgi:hypothetical protein